MASSDGDVEQLSRKVVQICVEKAAGGKKLSEAEKKQVNNKAATKVFQDTLGMSKDDCRAADIAFSKYCPKGKKDIDLETFMTKMLPEMAAEALAKKGGKKKEHSDPAVQEKLAQFKSKMAAKCKEWESAPTGGGDADVVKRLTDSSQYTGSHKSRFDESGKGKGIEGRKDIVDSSGYVGDYKNAGTYDKAHKN